MDLKIDITSTVDDFHGLCELRHNQVNVLYPKSRKSEDLGGIWNRAPKRQRPNLYVYKNSVLEGQTQT